VRLTETVVDRPRGSRCDKGEKRTAVARWRREALTKITAAIPTPAWSRAPRGAGWIDGNTAAVVARLGDEAAAGALPEGERLCLDGAVAYVRRARGERGRPAPGWKPQPHRAPVVDLVVGGLTNLRSRIRRS
jgi:hypothetical protein